MADMLSIAIKNSVILALVILIAHFLLKTSSEDKVVSMEPPLNQAPTAPTDSGAGAGHTDVWLSDKNDTSKGDDLYSYVYGSSAPVPITDAIRVPIPTSLSAGDNTSGLIQGYESGLSDQWCLI